jgi:iron complex transport system substrate-binding protein
MYGGTAITDVPRRVVALSSVDADTATALGVIPVLVPQAPGTEPGQLTPWFAASAGNGEVEIFNAAGGDQAGGLPYERIAAAEPDLILGAAAGIDAEQYATLSGIAPTVAPAIGNFLDAWPDVTRTVGAALGRPDEAERLVAQTQDTITAAAGANPEFTGRTFGVSLLFAADQFGLLVDTQESTVSLMTALGFTLRPEVDQLEATSGYATQVSRERVGLLDADVTLAYAPQPDVARAYLADPLVQRATRWYSEARSCRWTGCCGAHSATPRCSRFLTWWSGSFRRSRA